MRFNHMRGVAAWVHVVEFAGFSYGNPDAVRVTGSDAARGRVRRAAAGCGTLAP
ncbi:MAG TPA: hypothetical protein VI636_16555 [Candidatus Angelobacter sp.]